MHIGRSAAAVLLGMSLVLVGCGKKKAEAPEKEKTAAEQEPVPIVEAKVELDASNFSKIVSMSNGWEWSDPRAYPDTLTQKLKAALNQLCPEINSKGKYFWDFSAGITWDAKAVYLNGPEVLTVWFKGKLALKRDGKDLNVVPFQAAMGQAKRLPNFMANLMDVAMAAVVSGLPGQGADGEKCEAYIWSMRDKLPRTREWTVTLTTGETIAVPHTSDTLWDLLLRTETPHSIVAVTDALRGGTPEEQLAAAQALQNAAADAYRREQIKKELAKFPDLAVKLTNSEAKGIIEKLR
jgi:hypothetical protein